MGNKLLLMSIMLFAFSAESFAFSSGLEGPVGIIVVGKTVELSANSDTLPKYVKTAIYSEESPGMLWGVNHVNCSMYTHVGGLEIPVIEAGRRLKFIVGPNFYTPLGREKISLEGFDKGVLVDADTGKEVGFVSCSRDGLVLKAVKKLLEFTVPSELTKVNAGR